MNLELVVFTIVAIVSGMLMSLFLNVLGFSIGKSDCEDSNNLLEIKNKVLRNELEKAENKIVDLEDEYIKTYEVMVVDNRPYSNHDTIIYKVKAGSKSEAIEKVLLTYYRESGTSGLDITTLAQVVDMEDK